MHVWPLQAERHWGQIFFYDVMFWDRTLRANTSQWVFTDTITTKNSKMHINILSSWLSYDSNYQWVIWWSHYTLQNSWKCVLLKKKRILNLKARRTIKSSSHSNDYQKGKKQPLFYAGNDSATLSLLLCPKAVQALNKLIITLLREWSINLSPRPFLSRTVRSLQNTLKQRVLLAIQQLLLHGLHHLKTGRWLNSKFCSWNSLLCCLVT